jgi:hypothetical protein
MTVIPIRVIQKYRRNTYRLTSSGRLRSPDQAVEYVKERGFIFFWPAKGVDFPSLWTATAGDRPVADEHDDPGHVTWSWKDILLGSKRLYYAKVLRRRGTFIANQLLPYFYALSENYGSMDEDYIIQYQEGRLSQEAKTVYESLLTHGILNTIDLRKAAHLASPENEGRFNKAVDHLMADFKILPVGISDAGAWHYSYLYDLVPRQYPELLETARLISIEQARSEILRYFFKGVGVAAITEIDHLFKWKPTVINQSLMNLVNQGFLVENLHIKNKPGLCYGLSQFT